MQEPAFNDMSPEDILAWIETAEKVLDQKVAAETADIEKRQQRLARLIARRNGKDDKAKAKAKIKPAAPKGRGRPPQEEAPATKPKASKTREPKAQEAKAQEAKIEETAVAAE